MISGGNNFNYFPENQLTKFPLCSPTSLFYFRRFLWRILRRRECFWTPLRLSIQRTSQEALCQSRSQVKSISCLYYYCALTVTSDSSSGRETNTPTRSTQIAYLTAESATITSRIIGSRMGRIDYCNSLLYYKPTTDPKQSRQTASSRDVSVKPLLKSLHRLSRHIHTVGHKKRASYIVRITLANMDRF